jgi:hypothetical protein
MGYTESCCTAHDRRSSLLRFIKLLLAVPVLGLALAGVSAQNTAQLELGDPPIASLIQVSPPDENGLVTISGAPGAVFPSAQVAIRNLYTNDLAYVQAGVTGSFSGTIYGPGNTPFWISPTDNIPNSARNRPGSLPGGPGTIIYGPFSQILAQTGIITQVVVDGDLGDWDDYLDNALVAETEPAVYAFYNRDSLYVAISGAAIPAEYAQLGVRFSLDGVSYNVALDPRLPTLAMLGRLNPNAADLGTLAAAAVQGDAIEIRIPLNPINPSNPTIETATLDGIGFIGADGSETVGLPLTGTIPTVAEGDGIVRLNSQIGDDFTRFTIDGTVAQGTTRWTARGRINSLNLNPGDTVILELDVTLTAPDFAAGVVDLQMNGELRLQPLADASGNQATGGLDSNNGWSNILTPSGLAIINLRGDLELGATTISPSQIIRRGADLLFPLTFEVQLPDDLSAGMYVPLFRGSGQVGDGEIFRWADNSILGTGSAAVGQSLTRLPLVLNVDGVIDAHLVWSLFQDDPSDGGRGVLTDEDKTAYALSNRVHFDSPTYILPPFQGATGEPIAYPIEPYLLNLMPNKYETTAPPLIPFFFPGGRLSASITRPDGEVDDLGSSAIFQNQLSTAALDERALFGAQSPIDIYRLTTLNNAYTDYIFSQYGPYEIELTGNLEDIYGNHYEGGGTYQVLIAEPLDILPGALPGTPFEVGDTFNASLHLSPGAPADVTITARIYPLDGGEVIEHTIQGQANRAGYFYAEGFSFDTPGEYIIDYEVRYTDTDGRLWAGSQRGAGVIANPEGAVIAHGQRGLDNFQAEIRPAWFNTRQYLAGVTNLIPRLNFPYHSGDVAWIDQGLNGQIKPIIQAQDMSGTYAQLLAAKFPNYVTPDGAALSKLAVEGELPLISSDGEAYSYISAVEPALTIRQFVQGGLYGGLQTYWDSDDPYNGQSGAGLNGDRAGDFVFLFGGAVTRGEVQDTAIYGALAVVIDGETDEFGTRVYPPYQGEAGGPNGGPLLTVGEQAVNMFFHPTGARPGDVLHLDDTLTIVGQVAPTLASIVSVTITSPSGQVRSFEGIANAIGYFYDPAQDFAVDEAGAWTVEIQVRHEGGTSAGIVEPPPPSGNVLGTQGGRFQVFVVSPDAPSLEWNDPRSDIAIPAGVPYNFNFPLPEDWINVEVYHVVTTPAYVLDETPIRPSGRSFSFQYNPTNLSKNFPNLENNGDGVGASASDVVTLTFVVTGIDGNGNLQARSRTYTIAHDRLTTFG